MGVWIENIHGGVVSDVVLVCYVDGSKVVFRRTPIIRDTEDNNQSMVLADLQFACKDGCLPVGFCVKEYENSIVTCYQWIDGISLSSFNSFELTILNELNLLHSLTGYVSTNSVYGNIHAEASYIKQQVKWEDNPLQDISEYIVCACNNILNNLHIDELSKILDCRGVLTHGDPKPANVINNRCKLQLIDWDKLCSLSPESDFVYALFTGKIGKKSFSEMKTLLGSCDSLNYKIFELSLKFIPDIYLIHDSFIYFSSGKRLDYVKDEVFATYQTWHTF